MQFHFLIGRTALEVIKVNSVLHPWGVRVTRSVTIERRPGRWGDPSRQRLAGLYPRHLRLPVFRHRRRQHRRRPLRVRRWRVPGPVQCADDPASPRDRLRPRHRQVRPLLFRCRRRSGRRPGAHRRRWHPWLSPNHSQRATGWRRCASGARSRRKVRSVDRSRRGWTSAGADCRSARSASKWVWPWTPGIRCSSRRCAACSEAAQNRRLVGGHSPGGECASQWRRGGSGRRQPRRAGDPAIPGAVFRGGFPSLYGAATRSCRGSSGRLSICGCCRSVDDHRRRSTTTRCCKARRRTPSFSHVRSCPRRRLHDCKAGTSPALADIFARSTSKGAFPPRQIPLNSRRGLACISTSAPAGNLALSSPISIVGHPNPLRIAGTPGHGSSLFYDNATIRLALRRNLGGRIHRAAGLVRHLGTGADQRLRAARSWARPTSVRRSRKSRRSS